MTFVCGVYLGDEVEEIRRWKYRGGMKEVC